MSKADRMRALDERARVHNLRAAEYERAKVLQLEADRAKQLENEERLRQHKQHMREIRAGKRPAVAAVKKAKRQSPPSVEIFVQTPKRAGVKSFSSADFQDDEDEEEEAPAAAVAARGRRGPNADVVMTAHDAEGGATTRFFVPLVTTGGQAGHRRSQSAGSPPRATAAASNDRPESRARSSAVFTASSIDPDNDRRGAAESVPTSDVDDDDVPESPPPLSDSANEEGPTAGAVNPAHVERSAALESATVDSHSPPHKVTAAHSDPQDASPTPITPSKAPVPVARAAPAVNATASDSEPAPTTHRVARQWRRDGEPESPVQLAAAQSAPAAAMSEPPREMPERQQPSRSSDGGPATRPRELDRDADLSLGMAGATAVTLAGAVQPMRTDDGPARSVPAASERQVAPARAAGAPNDKHADAGLVSVVEWNVDLIVRQLRRYMDDAVLHRVLRLCKAFATGPTETRTNPRANASLHAKLGSMINDGVAFTECAPLLSQLVALQATLATAEHLRAVESFDDDVLDGVIRDGE